jgi:hypothetical protein
VFVGELAIVTSFNSLIRILPGAKAKYLPVSGLVGTAIDQRPLDIRDEDRDTSWATFGAVKNSAAAKRSPAITQNGQALG